MREQIQRALQEDINTGDITAKLLPQDSIVSAELVTRQAHVLAGMQWFNEVFRQLDDTITISWNYEDGDDVAANSVVCELKGNARSIVTAERTALNFLQTLSATATQTKRYVNKIAHTKTQLLDTRKTIPGFREAQKYAVRCGGGHNHRMGLYDAYLIKENHIAACGSITAAVNMARDFSQDTIIEVEVENLQQFDEALAAGANIIMLDNFNLADIKTAVQSKSGQTKIEVSGNITLDNIADYAQTGIDYISVGAITKHVNAIDFSLRVNL